METLHQSNTGRLLLTGAMLGTVIGYIAMAGGRKNWWGNLKHRAGRLDARKMFHGRPLKQWLKHRTGKSLSWL